MKGRAASGAVRWTFYAQGPVRFAPTVDGGRVSFGSDDGHVYCLDAASGAPLWSRRAGPSDEKVLGNGRMISLWPVRTSVLVDRGTVYFAAGVFPYARILYVPSGRAMPAAFDRSNGEFLFFASPGGKRGGTWALLDDTRLIAGVDFSGAPAKTAYDATTGVRQEDAFAWFAGTDMAVTPEFVYLVNQDGVCAVNRSAYSAAILAAEGIIAEQQVVEKGLTASKAKLRKELTPAELDSLNAEVEQQTRQLAELAAKRADLQQSVYRWRYAGKEFTSVIRTGNLVVAGGRDLVVAIDMNDEAGTVWFAYPSPNTAKYTHFPDYGIKFDLQEQVFEGGGFFSRDFKGLSVAGTHKPWLFSSGCRGLLRCDIPLLDPDTSAAHTDAVYGVRMGFCTAAGDTPNQRVFDIVLQGKTVQEQCDIARLTGDAPRALVLEFAHIPVRDVLTLELKSHAVSPGPDNMPIINSLEVLRRE